MRNALVIISLTILSSACARGDTGTQNFNAVPTLVPALDFAESARENPEIQAEQKAILDYVYLPFCSLPRI